MKQPVERRLAAILVARVARNSIVIEASQLVDAKIKEHRGRIFSNPSFFTRSAEFRTPVDAVLCATEIQRAITDCKGQIFYAEGIGFQIGIAFGEVLVSHDFPSGDAVRVAEALARLAKPGGIWVNLAVRDHVRGRVDLPVDDWPEILVRASPEDVIAGGDTFFSKPPLERDEPEPRLARPVDVIAGEDTFGSDEPNGGLPRFEPIGREPERLLTRVIDGVRRIIERTTIELSFLGLLAALGVIWLITRFFRNMPPELLAVLVVIAGGSIAGLTIRLMVPNFFGRIVALMSGRGKPTEPMPPPKVTSQEPDNSVVTIAPAVLLSPGPRQDYKHELEPAINGGSGGHLELSISEMRDARIDARVQTPPAPEQQPPSDIVDVSAFALEGGAAGSEVLVQVFLHRLDDALIAAEQARAADPDAIKRGVRTLDVEIARGQRVDIQIEGRDATIDEPLQSIVWRGEPCACQYLVTLPRTTADRSCNLRVRVLLDGVPIGSLRFALKVSAGLPIDPESVGIRGDTASRYHRAFLSYATPDRPEVLKRAQALRAAQIGFFQDFLSIDPGQRWERRLYEEIDRCDLFLLFWSKSAAQSEWVLREAELAVARQNASPDEEPDIAPIILEGPPVPQPIPDSLKHLQFNDQLLYFISATEWDQRPIDAPQ
jgi:hypothetical protein